MEQILLAKGAFSQWRGLGQRLRLASDTAIAEFLIGCYKQSKSSQCKCCGTALCWTCPSCTKQKIEETRPEPESLAEACNEDTLDLTVLHHDPTEPQTGRQATPLPQPVPQQILSTGQTTASVKMEVSDYGVADDRDLCNDGGLGDSLACDRVASFRSGASKQACLGQVEMYSKTGPLQDDASQQMPGLHFPLSLTVDSSAVCKEVKEEMVEKVINTDICQRQRCQNRGCDLSSLKRLGSYHKVSASYTCQVGSRKLANSECLEQHTIACYRVTRSTCEPTNCEKGTCSPRSLVNVCKMKEYNGKCVGKSVSCKINCKPTIVRLDIISQTVADHKSPNNLKSPFVERIKPAADSSKSECSSKRTIVSEESKVDLGQNLCEHCGQNFTECHHLEQQKKTRTNTAASIIHRCDTCQKAYSTTLNLTRHQRRVHGAVASANSKSLVCHLCGKVLGTRAGLDYHIKFHAGQKNHACELCHRRFILPGQLREHMFTHAAAKPYACQICSKVYSHPSSLKKHKLLHTDRKHVCSTCGKKFYQVCHLKRHELTHLGKKPCVCSVCCKAFTQSSHLKQHQRVHSREIKTGHC